MRATVRWSVVAVVMGMAVGGCHLRLWNECDEDVDCDGGEVCASYTELTASRFCLLPAERGERCGGFDGDGILKVPCIGDLRCERDPNAVVAEEICVPSTGEGSIDSGGEGEGEEGEGEDGCEDPTLSCAASGDVVNACGVVVDDCDASELCRVHPDDGSYAYCNGTCEVDSDCGAGLVCLRYGEHWAACTQPAAAGISCAGSDGDWDLTHSCAAGLTCTAQTVDDGFTRCE